MKEAKEQRSPSCRAANATGRVFILTVTRFLLLAYYICITPTQGLADCSSAKRIDLFTAADGAAELGHMGPVTAVVLSPDGTTLATASRDDTLILWDLASARVLWRERTRVSAVAFTLDGRKLMVVEDPVDTSRPYRALTCWDVQARKKGRRRLLDASEGHGPAAISPDGKRIVCAVERGGHIWPRTDRLLLWGVEPTETVRVLPVPDGLVTSLAFSRDGAKIAAGFRQGRLLVWDCDNGEKLADVTGPTEVVVSLAISPDGRTILAGSSDGAAILWNLESGGQAHRLRSHCDQVASVSFSPDGQRMATASWDATVVIWDVEAGRKLQTISDLGCLTCVAFTPDSEGVLAGSWLGCTNLWNAHSRELLQHFGTNTGAANSVAFTPDGSSILAAYDGSVAILWDLETGELVRFFRGSGLPFYSVAVSPDGNSVLMGSGTWSRVAGSAVLWDAKTGERLGAVAAGTEWAITSVAFDPQGDTMLTCASLWDAQTAKPLWTFDQYCVGSSAFSPGGEFVLMAGTRFVNRHYCEGAVTICDSETGRKKIQFNTKGKMPFGMMVYGVSFSPDGSKVAVASSTGVSTWDPRTGKKLQQFADGTGQIKAVAFGPDGRRLAGASSAHTVILWDATTCRQLRQLTGHCSAVTCVTFSPDGQYVLSGSVDKSLILWDTETGKMLRRYARSVSLQRTYLSSLQPVGR